MSTSAAPAQWLVVSMTSSRLEALQIRSGAFCGADLEDGIAAVVASVGARHLVPVFGAGVSVEAPSAFARRGRFVSSAG
jgi:hypothetical protein